MTATVKFQVGKTYETSSIGDSNCKIAETIVARTTSTVTTAKGKKFRISEYNGVEQFKPWGSYSMAPILAADDEIEAKAERRANRLSNVPGTRPVFSDEAAVVRAFGNLPKPDATFVPVRTPAPAPAPAPAVAKPVPATVARLALPVPVWASLALANVLIVACANPIPGVEIEGE
jgi:hypothetical protein